MSESNAELTVPFTLAFVRSVKGAPLECFWSAVGEMEKLERERDALKAALVAHFDEFREFNIKGTLYNQVQAALKLS